MGISQDLVSSMAGSIDAATDFILMLKARVTAARQLADERYQTIREKEAEVYARDEQVVHFQGVVAERDATITDRNEQIEVLVTLADELRAQVTSLGGSLVETEARYQEQLVLAAAAQQERAAAELARVEAEAIAQRLSEERQAALAAAEQRLAEKEALIAAEEEEERIDAIEMGRLSAAIERLKEAATES